MIMGTITLLKKKEELQNINMISVTITVSNTETGYKTGKQFLLEDADSFKNHYDCEAIRELVEIVNK